MQSLLPTTAPPPHGRWRDGLCNFCSESHSCLMGCCLTPCLVGQLYEKTVGPKGIFVRLLPALVVLWLVSSCDLSAVLGPVYSSIKNLAQIALWLVMSFMLLTVRRNVREHYNIPEGNTTCCSDEDCLCAFCCTGCVSCQVARHVYSYPQTYTCSDGCSRFTTTGDRAGEETYMFDLAQLHVHSAQPQIAVPGKAAGETVVVAAPVASVVMAKS